LLGRVSDDIARAEYVRFAARLIGVEPETIQRALTRGGRAASGNSSIESDPAPTRIDEELMRVVLANPVELAGVEIIPELFSTAELREAMTTLNVRRNTTPAGEPLSVEGFEHSDRLSRLAHDGRPLPKDPVEVVRRALSKAIEAEIDEVETELAHTDPQSEGHSELLRRLIALQGERRLRDT
jgi:hypothetical protein